jgi:hypothetical protein
MPTTAWSITQSGRYEPFELQVARGQISWHNRLFQFGTNTNVGTGFSTIWSGGSSTLYTYPSSATVLEISSASANDTAAGTGARTVLVNGLDANYNEQSEIVSLNGQTAVNTVGSYLRFHSLDVLTVGSGGTAAGILYAGVGTVTAGVPATIYGQVPLGYNTSDQAFWTVPAGYTAYLTSCTWTSANTTANIIVTGSLNIRPLGSVFSVQSTCKMTAGMSFDRHFDTAVAIAEKSDIEMRAASSTAGSAVTGEFHIIYIQNDANV